MSDGPHRSLPMPKHWKLVAKRAANPVYTPEEIKTVYEMALQAELRRIMGLIGTLRRIADDPQGSLFPDLGEAVMMQDAHVLGPLAGLIADCLVRNAAHDFGDTSRVDAAVREGLAGYSLRAERQIDEHYQRNGSPKMAEAVRDRVRQAGSEARPNVTPEKGTNANQSNSPQSSRQSGLDQGVQL